MRIQYAGSWMISVLELAVVVTSVATVFAVEQVLGFCIDYRLHRQGSVKVRTEAMAYGHGAVWKGIRNSCSSSCSSKRRGPEHWRLMGMALAVATIHAALLLYDVFGLSAMDIEGSDSYSKAEFSSRIENTVCRDTSSKYIGSDPTLITTALSKVNRDQTASVRNRVCIPQDIDLYGEEKLLHCSQYDRNNVPVYSRISLVGEYNRVFNFSRTDRAFPVDNKLDRYHVSRQTAENVDSVEDYIGDTVILGKSNVNRNVVNYTVCAQFNSQRSIAGEVTFLQNLECLDYSVQRHSDQHVNVWIERFRLPGPSRPLWSAIEVGRSRVSNNRVLRTMLSLELLEIVTRTMPCRRKVFLDAVVIVLPSFIIVLTAGLLILSNVTTLVIVSARRRLGICRLASDRDYLWKRASGANVYGRGYQELVELAIPPVTV